MPLWTHPASVGESYWQHLKYAFGLGCYLFKASAHAFRHGLLPDLPQDDRYDLIGVAEYTMMEALRRVPKTDKKRQPTRSGRRIVD